MIITEYYATRADGIKLYVSYSDSDLKIRQSPTNAEYDSAIDVENSGYTYTETDTPVDEPVVIEPYEEPVLPAQAVLDRIFGGKS